MSRVDESNLIDLDKVRNSGGAVAEVSSGHHVPFTIRRAFYLYDIPAEAERGGHAHSALEQFIVAIAGSFAVTLDDGNSCRTYALDRSDVGLYVPSMIWAQLTGFSSDAVCLVFASGPYDETEYIRDYQRFLDTIRAAKRGGGVE